MTVHSFVASEVKCQRDRSATDAHLPSFPPFDCQKLICASPRSNAPPTIYAPTRATGFAQFSAVKLAAWIVQATNIRDAFECRVVPCAAKRPAGQTPYLRIARAARRSCGWLERRDVLTVYPTCTSSNAEC